MIAASSSLSPSSAALASSSLHRRKPLRRSLSFRQIRIPRSPQPPRTISASYASPAAAERQRENPGGYYYSYSRSHSGTAGGGVGEPDGTLAAAAGSLYDVLGVSGCATAQEIKAAFRRLARERHPDVAAADRKGASAEFMRIHAAYSTLSDPDKRAAYDSRMLASAPRRRPNFSSGGGASSSASSYCYNPYPASVNSSCSSTFSRRTWETDQCW